MSGRPLIPREQVAQQFEIATTALVHYESAGLVRSERKGDVEGYGPAEIRRLWTILSLQRDLGINLAGVEAVLKLRAHMEVLHRRLDALAEELRDLLDILDEPDAEA
jgi:MerR family transcriptional regulator/heat shock protein HspR